MLLLDSSHNVHSIVYKDQKWTASYWDEFASLPAIVPKGPIAILGLLIDKAREYLGLSDLEKQTQAGGILNVHIGDALSPSVNIPGGYAGEILVYMALCITRSTFFCFFGCCAQIQGFVCNFCTRAYFPSIVVDLFSDGKVLSQLQEKKSSNDIQNTALTWPASNVIQNTALTWPEKTTLVNMDVRLKRGALKDP
ncbi:hypothetical protein C1H46_004411 [Malus baccata]|uniref:Uncharacterized protein n=1 Tax=Malus baccata TaxID=106549 RepID=A0A540NG49_MALBA|nr:hypothetical protein C1H46_004411 [Malus baccata]